MAKNNRITRKRDLNLRYVENHLKRKEDRQTSQRTQPLDEKTTPARAGSFDPTPSTTVVNIPLTSKSNVFQGGWMYQGSNEANLGAFRAGAGKNGEDVLRVSGNSQGLHKTNSANMMVHDRGQFSVWVKGFDGGAGSGTDEYVMSIHQLSTDTTPVDEESLVIVWDKTSEELRLYPDITNYPTTYEYISLPESDWQEETWHQIRATWSYQDQIWTLKWDDTGGVSVTPTTPDSIPWPEWDEGTKIEMFTDLNFENDIYHDCQFLSFGQTIFDQATTGVIQDISCFSSYIEENIKFQEENIHGAFKSLATAQILDALNPVNVTKQAGKIYLVLNAGVDVSGSITITGTSVDRDTGVQTGADTESIAIDGLTTDNSSTDAQGNIIHSFEDGYISTKWWTGTVTISTTDVTLSDMDVWHLSFEQFNDMPGVAIQTWDINTLTTNANAWMYTYLYKVAPDGSGKCDIDKIEDMSIASGAATANTYCRLRRGDIGTRINGELEGIWVDVFFGPVNQTYFQDFTHKLWFTTEQSVAVLSPDPVSLQDAYDNSEDEDRKITIEDGDPVQLDFGLLSQQTVLDIRGGVDLDGDSTYIMRNSGGNIVDQFTPSSIVFNEQGEDRDFRIEGDADANLFFIDASEDKIGIGKNNPAWKVDIDDSLAVYNTDTATPVDGESVFNLYLEATDSDASPNFVAQLVHVNVDTDFEGQGAVAYSVYYDNSTSTVNTVKIDAIGTLQLAGGVVTTGAALDSGSRTSIFNENGDAEADFRVESDTQTHMLFVDAGNNKVGIADSTPSFELDVTGDINATKNIYGGINVEATSDVVAGVDLKGGSDIFLTNPNAISIYATTTTVAASSTWTKIDLDNTNWTRGGTFSAANSRFTVDEDGIYDIDVCMYPNIASGQSADMAIRINGVVSRSTRSRGVGQYESMVLSCKLDLEANDYIEIWMRTSSGATMTALGSVTNTWVDIQKIS